MLYYTDEYGGWSLIFISLGCLSILWYDNSKSNSWNDFLAVVRDRYFVSSGWSWNFTINYPVSASAPQAARRSYFHTRLSYNVNDTSTFLVSRLPLCGDVATNPWPPRPKMSKFSCIRN